MNKVKTFFLVITFPIWFPIAILWNAIFDDGTAIDGAYEEMRNEEEE